MTARTCNTGGAEGPASCGTLGTITGIASGADFFASWDWTSTKYYLQTVSRDILDNNRLNACMRVPAPHAQSIDVHRSDDGNAAHYRNLVRCANVWICPVCSATVSTRRRNELSKALANAWYWSYMVTYTMHHSEYMRLKDTIASITEAYRKMTSGRAYKRIKDEWHIVGAVKALEVTYGANGWHPHMHLLLLMRKEINHGGLQAELAERWSKCVKRAGGYASVERGTDVLPAEDSVSEYIAKFGRLPKDTPWSIEDEIARQPTKKGKRGGLAPLTILMGAASPETPEKAAQAARDLWREYAEAMHGRHQLQYSRGTKDLMDIDYLPDDEVVDCEAEDMPIFASLTRQEWDKIIRNNARAEVLKLAMAGDEKVFWRYMHNLT